MRRRSILLMLLAPALSAAQAPSDLYRAAVAAAEGALTVFDARAANQWLRLAPERERGWEWRYYASRLGSASTTDALGRGPLSELEASPDGRFAAVGTPAGDVLLVEPGAGAPARVIARGVGFVYATTFSADGRLLAVGSADRNVRIYTTASGALVRTIATGTERPLELAFDPDGARIAAAMSGAIVRVWNAASGDSLLTLTGHMTRRPVPAVAFLGSGTLVSGSWDNHLRVWDLAASASVRTLGPGYGGRVAHRWNEVVVDPRGRYVAATGSDGDIHLWSTADWSEQVIPGHRGDVPALAVSPDGEFLATGSIDQTVRVWRVADLSAVATWLGHEGPVQAVSFQRDGRTVLSVADDGTLRSWSLDAARRTTLPQETSAYAIAWLERSNQVAFVNHTGRLLMYDRADGRLRQDIAAHTGPVIGIAHSADEARMVTVPQRGPLRVWATRDFSVTRELGDTTFARRVLGAVLTPDGARIVAARGDGVVVWNASTGDEIHRLRADSGRAPLAVALHGNGPRVFVGWNDGSVSTWNIESGTRGSMLRGTGGGIVALAVDPGTGTVVAGSERGELSIWDGESAAPRARWHAHDGPVSGIAVAPRGGRIASAGNDMIVRVWSMADGSSLATLRGLSAYVLSFSPDEATLAVTGLDRQVRLLDAQSPVTTEVQVDDSTRLTTDVYLPAAGPRQPAVIIRTPYDRAATAQLARRIADAGYAVVVQSVRHTPRFVPFVFEQRDGVATVRWVRSQAWCDGRVALWGASYQAYAAFQLAAADSTIAALVSVGGFADLGAFFNRGGAFRLADHLPWLMQMQMGGLPPRAALEGVFRTAPLERMFGNQQAVGAAAQVPFDFAKVRAPTLHITGWWDYVNRDAFGTFAAMTRAARQQALIVGPWSHNGALSGETSLGGEEYGAAAALGTDAAADASIAWLDRYVKGRPGDTAVAGGVSYFVMGANIWRQAATWPDPSATPARLYLTRDASGRGMLSPVSGGPARDSIRYDPNSPLPTIGGANSPYLPWLTGPVDQRPLIERGDIALFASGAFADPTSIVGPVRLSMTVSSSTPDAQLSAKLIEARASGAHIPIADGIVSLTGVPAADAAPGLGSARRFAEVTVDLGHAARQIAAGSRLVLLISGGDFPKYARAAGDGTPPFAATRFLPTTLFWAWATESPAYLAYFTVR